MLTTLILIAFGVGEGLRWSDFWIGFLTMAGLLVVLLIPLLIIFVAALLWNAILFRVFWKRGGSLWLKLAILSPALVLLGFGVFSRPTSPERFEEITEVAFPSDYSDTKFHHYGGGFADHSHTFVFTTTPEETERLIHELELTQEDTFSDRDFDKLMEEYPGGTFHHRNVENQNWYYDFITDKSRTKVWIRLWGF